MHRQSHTIYRLPVHCEHEQNVYYQVGQEEERLRQPNVGRTKLTQFFALNGTDEDARQRLYTEIPHYYTWQQPTREWRRRRNVNNRPTLARMYSVNPRDRERFYLRLLLLYRRGPTSFRDLRTVNGVVYQTYVATATALGYLEDDNAWRLCMSESAVQDTPRQLRYLFSTILLNCGITNPLTLYEANEVNL